MQVAYTTTSVEARLVGTPLRSWVGVWKTVSSIGKSPILGTLTGVRKATSVSSSARVELMIKQLLQTPPRSGAGRATPLKRWWCESLSGVFYGYLCFASRLIAFL